MEEKKVLVLLGPTALGKTDIALYLAKKYKGELIACDSRQIYKGMDIGTGKMPEDDQKIVKGEGCWIVNGVRIWLYDVVSPKEDFNVKGYVEIADKVIEKIMDEGKLPIIVGGSGFYLKGLLDGFSNFGIPKDPKLKFFLESLTLESLQKKLQLEDKLTWESMNNSDRQNKRRLIRKLEINAMRNYKSGEEVIPLAKKYSILKIGLVAQKEILNLRIDERVDRRIKQGMIEEGIRLNTQGLSLYRMRSFGLEYECIADFLERKIDKEEFISKLKIKIHQFAKRQVSWFKREKDVQWFDRTDPQFRKHIEAFVSDWLSVIESPK